MMRKISMMASITMPVLLIAGCNQPASTNTVAETDSNVLLPSEDVNAIEAMPVENAEAMGNDVAGGNVIDSRTGGGDTRGGGPDARTGGGDTRTGGGDTRTGADKR